MAGKKCPPNAPPEKNASKTGNKPNMRGMHTRQSLRNVYTALGLSILGGVATYFLLGQRRKQAYEEFYKTYDANAAFDRMLKAGVFSSAKPEPPPEKPKKGLICF